MDKSVGLTASQSVPNGPYDHITSMGNARGAKFEARAQQNSNKAPPGSRLTLWVQMADFNGAKSKNDFRSFFTIVSVREVDVEHNEAAPTPPDGGTIAHSLIQLLVGTLVCYLPRTVWTFDVLQAQLGQPWSGSDKLTIKYSYGT